MVSLKTIAEKCGVSTATVSKALNDQKDISEETKSRIRTVAEQLGYFPNAAARSLKTNHSYNLGVLFEEEAGRGLQHEYFSGVLTGQIYLFSGTQEDRLHPRTAEWFGSYQRPVDKFLPDNG